jgi:hypothetical protein
MSPWVRTAIASFLSYKFSAECHLICLPFMQLQVRCPSLATHDVSVHLRPLLVCSVITKSSQSLVSISAVVIARCIKSLTSWEWVPFVRRQRTFSYVIDLCWSQWLRGQDMNCLHSLERWDHGFESHSRHGCPCAFILCFCVALCLGSGLTMGWSPVQGVLQTVYKIKKLKKKLAKAQQRAVEPQ